MQEGAETVVSRVLEPGEKILWAGRPNADVALDHRAQRRRRNELVMFPIAVIAILWMTRSRILRCQFRRAEHSPA